MHLPIAQHHHMTSKLLGTAGGSDVAADEPPAKCQKNGKTSLSVHMKMASVVHVVPSR